MMRVRNLFSTIFCLSVLVLLLKGLNVFLKLALEYFLSQPPEYMGFGHTTLYEPV